MKMAAINLERLKSDLSLPGIRIKKNEKQEIIFLKKGQKRAAEDNFCYQATYQGTKKRWTYIGQQWTF